MKLSGKDYEKRKRGLICGMAFNAVAFIVAVIPVFLRSSILSSIPFLSEITGATKALKILFILIAELFVAIPVNLFYYKIYYERTTGKLRGTVFRRPSQIIPLLAVIAGEIAGVGAVLHLASPSSMLLFDGINILGAGIQYLVFRH